MVLECFEPHLKSKMRKIIAIVISYPLPTRANWWVINILYAVDYIFSDCFYHFSTIYAIAYFFPITRSATDVIIYSFIFIMHSSTFGIEVMLIQKYTIRKVVRYTTLIHKIIASRILLRSFFYVTFQSA